MQLYVCCIASPGEGKTRALKPIREPVERWIAEENKRRESDVLVTAKEYEDAKAEFNSMKRTATREARRLAAQKVIECKNRRVFPFPLLSVDATPAALEEDLQKYRGAIFPCRYRRGNTCQSCRDEHARR